MQRYATPPPAHAADGPAPALLAAAVVATRAAVTSVDADELLHGNARPRRGAVAAASAHVSTSTNSSQATDARTVTAPVRGALAETLASVSTHVSSSLAGAGRAFGYVPPPTEASSMAEDDEEVASGSRRPTSAPAPFGASAGAAGVTSGGALAALAALLLLVAPGLGPRLFSQIGKRSAVFMLLDTRPG